MPRLLTPALLLLIASPAAARQAGGEEQGGEAPEAERAGDRPGRILGELESLEEIELPGEGWLPAPAGPGDRLGGLAGKPISQIVAFDPPAGFDPAGDAEIPPGAALEAEVVRLAIERLWATGRYRNIRIWARPRPDGAVDLLIGVEPLLRITRIDVTGNKALDAGDVGRAVEYSPHRTILAEPPVLLELKQRLLTAYALRGYPRAEAVLRLETTGEAGEVALAVEIREGRPDRWDRIEIEGLPEGALAARLVRDIGLHDGTIRDRSLLDRAIERLPERLARLGYRDARIGKAVERQLGEGVFALAIPVTPGIRTRLLFAGNRRLRAGDLERLLSDGYQLKTTPAGVASAAARIERHYRLQGLLHARAWARRICRDGDRAGPSRKPAEDCPAATADQDLVFFVREGPPTELAGVVFKGNSYLDSQTLDRELRAFLGERNERSALFQPIQTTTIDDLGVSDNRPGRLGRARGALAPVSDPERIYVPELFSAALEHLAGLYRERGYLDVSVSDRCRVAEQPALRRFGMAFRPLVLAGGAGDGAAPGGETSCVFISEDRDLVLAVVRVEEGHQTMLDEIGMEGNTILSSRQLLEVARLVADEPYNEFRLHEARRDITAAYGARGHVFAEVNWQRTFSPDKRGARVVFEIREGPAVRVSRIQVRGNVATSRRLIRERLALRPGDLVTPRALAESETRLMELGIFDGATVQVAGPDKPASSKVVVVQVVEGKPQYLELRGGLATVEGARGGFEYGYRNIGGWAIGARLRARANYRLLFLGNSDVQADFERRYHEMVALDRLERHLLLGLSTDHFPGTWGVIGAGIDGINERINVPAFSADRTSGFFKITSRYLRWLPIELRTGVERSDIVVSQETGGLVTNPAFTRWVRIPEGDSLFWVTGAKISFDRRDDIFNPSRGVFASVAADLVRSLSNFDRKPVLDAQGAETGEYIDRVSNLIRGQAVLSGYIPFKGTEVVLALSAQAGYVFHLQEDSTTWPDRFFYLGGVGTLRGFTEESLVPEDVYQNWKSQLRNYSPEADQLLRSPGGESMFLLRSEFRFPLAKGFYGAGFFEAGNIWRERTNIDPLTLRPVTGAGLRYLTPLGPIAFDLGLNLDRRPHEDRFAWSFSIGSAF
jgi:outer membrane protein assembly factor BamA